MPFEIIDREHQELPDRGLWAAAAFQQGQYGVMLMYRRGDISQGVFLPERKLESILRELEDPTWVEMVRAVMPRIPLLRARMERQ